MLGGAGLGETEIFGKDSIKRGVPSGWDVHRLLQRYRVPPSVIAHAIVQNIDVPRFDRSASQRALRAAIRTSPPAKPQNLQGSAISQSGMRPCSGGRLRTTLTQIVHGRV